MIIKTLPVSIIVFPPDVMLIPGEQSKLLIYKTLITLKINDFIEKCVRLSEFLGHCPNGNKIDSV